MKMPFLKLGLLALILACLAACSDSNNLKDPSSSTTTAATSCDPSQAGCVEGQFVADQVVSGLGYTCTSTSQSITVTSVTDSSGFFTCPSGSSATFYIGSLASSNQVILGSAVVYPQVLPSSSTSVAQTSGIVTITPSMLILSGSSTVVSIGDPAANIPVMNMVRFLKAIDDDGQTWQDPQYSGFNGSNRILIDNNVAGQVGKLAQSLQPAEFQGTDLSPALEAFIDSIPGKDYTVDVPPLALAQQQYHDFLNGSFAGVYFASGLPCSSTDPGSVLGQEIYNQGMCNPSGVGSAPRSGDLMLFVDRTGYGFGFGVTSQSNIISTQPTAFYVEGLDASGKNPAKGNDLTRPFSYATDELALGAESQTGQTPLPAMSWSGTLNRGVIASTVSNYQLFYGQALTASISSTLGLWTYDANNSSTQPAYYVPNGQFFMYDAKPANPFLNSSVYSQLQFPINLQLTFEYPQSSGSACNQSTDKSGYCYLDMSPPSVAPGAVYDSLPGTLQISILKNGNIITNLNQDCNQLLDPSAAVLTDTSGGQEYRIGFVSTVGSGVMPSDSTNTTVNQLSLTLLFPQNSNVALPPALQGVLAGVYSSLEESGGTSVSGLVELPVSGGSAFTVVPADNMLWDNYFASVSNSGSASTGGILVIKKASQQCTASS